MYTRSKTRGFTLTELMVAVTGGLFVSLAVFALARDGSKFYQREQRVSDATLSAVIGFERLRTDIARAGFLSTPNVRKDPNLCGTPDGTWPQELASLASVRIDQSASVAAGSPANTTLNANGRFPAAIQLSGSYSAPEQFPIWNLQTQGATYIVYLQHNTGPLGRMGYNAADPTTQRAMLLGVFGIGRGLRIQDQSGDLQFGTISDVTEGIQPSITLTQSPVLQFRDAGNNLCGLKGNVTGATVNPVNFIRYDVRSLSGNADYAPIYANNNQIGDADRTELVREEFDTSGNPIQNTQELVAQFAVDLKFSLTAATSVAGGSDPLIQAVPDDDVSTTWAGDIAGLPGNSGPERIKSVRVRLSVRSREADRGEDMPVTADIAPGFYRIGLGNSAISVAPPGPPFARVRNLQADVALNNQMGIFW
jgi:hypothetical protein